MNHNGESPLALRVQSSWCGLQLSNIKLSFMKPTHPKIIIGPGGLHCPCCRCGTLKQSRVRLNRITRRIEKQKLQLKLKVKDFEFFSKTTVITQQFESRSEQMWYSTTF